MKKLTTVVLIGFVMTLTILTLGACGNDEASQSEESTASEATTPEATTPEATLSPEEKSAIDKIESNKIDDAQPSQESTPGETPSESKPVATGMKRVGEENYGYIDIPEDWVNFVDVAGNGGSVQYSDVIGQNIITMGSVYSPEGDPEVVLSAIGEGMSRSGAEDIASSTVTLNGIDAKQVYGYFPSDDTALVTWAFKSEDGYVHMIIAEGPTDSIMETVTYIESSYSLTK